MSVCECVYCRLSSLTSSLDTYTHTYTHTSTLIQTQEENRVHQKGPESYNLFSIHTYTHSRGGQ